MDLCIDNQADLSSEGPKQLFKDIESSTDETSMHCDKLKYPRKSVTVGVDAMQFENIIHYDNQEYKRKLELGKNIFEFINKNGIYQQSPRSE